MMSRMRIGLVPYGPGGHGGLGVTTPWKYVGGSGYVLTPKMSHSFIQNNVIG